MKSLRKKVSLIALFVFGSSSLANANSFSDSLRQVRNNIHYRFAMLPAGVMQKNNLPTDALDKAMFDVTYETHAEVATIELLNEEGEILAIRAHTQGRDTNVGGESAGEAIDTVIAEMTNGAWADSVKKIRIRHTHPPEGTYSNFSPADRRMPLYLKAYFDLNLGRPIEMESQLIFSKNADRPRKKTIIIPASISLQQGDYKTDSHLDQFQGLEYSPTWVGSSVASSIELSDSLVLDIFKQLSAEVWGPEYNVSTELGRLKRLLVLNQRSLGSYHLDMVKNAKTKAEYLFRLHVYLNGISNPTSIIDYFEAKALIQETMSSHFTYYDDFTDVLSELINFDRVAKNELEGILSEFDVLSVGWHHDAVLRSIIVIAQFTGANSKTRALLERIVGYFSETGRFARAVLNKFNEEENALILIPLKTCSGVLK